ncbi:unnamed protein product [Gemmataceae bacterium]|nr:unnamed protein product [Gemmataceae bacterium]VTT98937.1 unnamed protein product [Gemmataceae bacterium]
MSTVAGAVATAIAAKITALSIPGATVVRRKKPSLPVGTEPLQIVVCVGDAVSIEALTATKDLITRPVAVCVISAGGKKTGDDDAFRGILEQIRVAVNQRNTFTGVPQFNRIDPTKEAPFDAAALKQDLNMGVIAFAVQTIEARA